jgi:hypothetical protein
MAQLGERPDRIGKVGGSNSLKEIKNGDMAQLGERRVRIAKVGGSNPPISTKFKGNEITYFIFRFL